MGRMVTIDEAAEVAEDWYGGVVTDAGFAIACFCTEDYFGSGQAVRF